ncbi:hypothetical protein TWF506_005344 [Arthrobotrys conoides]|uniref:Ribonuclease H1 N-terminal domain-containing protein n=1 Tax=Arthrobotrys conoides TaxID=74498 RepID=A0AAN8RVZ0_9PEZI
MSNRWGRPNDRGGRYAVSNGRQTGVFDSYRDQVHPSTDRYPSNVHQRFSSREAAERALGRSQSSHNDNGPHYAVRNGRNPGIYPDWIRAGPEVLGHPHNEHRRFESRAEAEQYMNRERSRRSPSSNSSISSYQNPRYSAGRGYRSGFDPRYESESEYGTTSESSDGYDERTGYASSEYSYDEGSTNRDSGTEYSGDSGYGYNRGRRDHSAYPGAEDSGDSGDEFHDRGNGRYYGHGNRGYSGYSGDDDSD